MNDTVAEWRDEFKKNEIKRKEWRIEQLNKLKNWLDIEIETENKSCKDQNDKNLINADVSYIKKQIDCSLKSIDDYMATVNINETINKKLTEYQSSDVVVILLLELFIH